ncbi:MAG: zinc-ribbon domain-containing protein [Pyrinomonadaceae bacterium]
MPKTETAKEVCSKCGADVREGTTFCYNCGSPLAEQEPQIDEIVIPLIEETPEVDEKTKAALDDLAERLKLDEDEDKKLAKAAAERRKARVSQRKSSEYTWEPSDDSSGGWALIAAIAFAVFAAIVVFIALFRR